MFLPVPRTIFDQGDERASQRVEKNNPSISGMIGSAFGSDTIASPPEFNAMATSINVQLRWWISACTFYPCWCLSAICWIPCLLVWGYEHITMHVDILSFVASLVVNLCLLLISYLQEYKYVATWIDDPSHDCEGHCYPGWTTWTHLSQHNSH